MDDEILLTSDGSHTIVSSRFGVSYHSRFGAIQESMHVFINAGLRYKAVSQDRLSILEMGFGSGLNALLSLWEGQRKDLHVDYTTVEAYPISSEQARRLNFVQALDAPELAQPFLQMHDGPWNESMLLMPHFTFTKWRSTLEAFETDKTFDVIYFDAFAPTTQPELWELPIFEKMYRLLNPGGVLTTYSAKGSVKRNLKAIGFALESLEGPPGKREMTRAIKQATF